MADSSPHHEPQSGEQRFRAHLAAYLDSLLAGELAGRVGSAAGVSIQPSGPSRIRRTCRSTLRLAMSMTVPAPRGSARSLAVVTA